MFKPRHIILTFILCTLHSTLCTAQMLSVQTDVLWDAAMAPNIGLELTVGDKSTLQINAMTAHKPYSMSLHATVLQPEYRYYFSGRPMHKHFVGIGGIGGVYKMDHAGKEYDGYGVGAGLTFGYVLPVAKRLNIDFHAGLGLAVYRQKEHFNGQPHETNNGYEIANARGALIMPTRIGVSVAYVLK